MEPKGSNTNAKRSAERRRMEQKGAKRKPNDTKGNPKEPKGRQMVPNGAKRVPKGSQPATKMRPKIDFRKRSRKGCQKVLRVRPIWEPFGVHFLIKPRSNIDADIDVKKT